MYVAIGLVQLAVYYFVFRALITHLNLKTIGRGEAEMKLQTKDDYKNRNKTAAIDSAVCEFNSVAIIEGLGGKDNIVDVQNCYTRLRVEVRDPSLVDEAKIQESNPMGLVNKGQNIQIIFGSHVASVRQEVNEFLEAMA